LAGQIKVDSINADSNLALKIANTAVAFIDSSGLRPISGNLNLDATATSKLYLPSANTVAIQTAGVTAVTVDSSQNVTLAGTLTTTGITNSGVSTFAAGTALLPALTTTGDTNTGVWFPAADTIAASTGGTERIRIDSDGALRLMTSNGLGNGAVFNSKFYANLAASGTAVATVTSLTVWSVLIVEFDWVAESSNAVSVSAFSGKRYIKMNSSAVNTNTTINTDFSTGATLAVTGSGTTIIFTFTNSSGATVGGTLSMFVRAMATDGYGLASGTISFS
jgi:hypothetical protein